MMKEIYFFNVNVIPIDDPPSRPPDGPAAQVQFNLENTSTTVLGTCPGITVSYFCKA